MNENFNESIQVTESDTSANSEFEKADSVDEELLSNSVGSTESDLKNSDNPDESQKEEKPTSTVIQVKPADNSEGYETTELDVESLNFMAGSYVEELKTVNQGTNDYYAFIDEPIADYFAGIMAQYPLNEYKACHLRHWVQNTQYYTYYDDYYYLWYDLGHNNNYIEVVKYNGQANYVVNRSSGEVLNSTISYGSEVGQSDLRRGVSYVQEMSFLCVLAGVLVLYVVHAIFRHLKG